MNDGSAKRRVAYVCSEFLPASQSFIYQELVAHRRYEIEAFARRRINAERFPFAPVHTLRPPRDVRAAVEYLRYVGLRRNDRFERRLRGFDLVHAQFGPAAVQIAPLCHRLKVPLVCTFGGVDVQVLVTNMRFRPAHWAYWPYWWWSRDVLAKLDRILAVSRDLADKLVSAGAPPERVHVFHRGVRVPAEVPDPLARPTPRVVLVVGRLVEKKGITYAIDAFARAELPPTLARLRIIGEGPLRARLRDQIRAHDLGGRVELLGECTQTEVFREMERASLLLVPSVSARNGDAEGVPNVLKEAAARAVPAIGTRHGGIPEAIEDGITGRLVGERDVGGLAVALTELLQQDERRAQMGAAARAKMLREFDMPRRIEVLERHYDQVLAERKRR